ncbi:MAG: AMMECR1 domain-containing protein, partial [Candidatus Micrarchaeaceae archaeon]
MQEEGLNKDEAKPYSLEEGRELVEQARHVIEAAVTSTRFNKAIMKEQLHRFRQHHGVFVTIEFYPTEVLRGCIGFVQHPENVSSLLVEAALAAATEDPRFVPVSRHELEHLI